MKHSTRALVLYTHCNKVVLPSRRCRIILTAIAIGGKTATALNYKRKLTATTGDEKSFAIGSKQHWNLWSFSLVLLGIVINLTLFRGNKLNWFWAWLAVKTSNCATDTLFSSRNLYQVVLRILKCYRSRKIQVLAHH